MAVLDSVRPLAGSDWAILFVHVVPTLCISSLSSLQGASAEKWCPMYTPCSTALAFACAHGVAYTPRQAAHHFA